MAEHLTKASETTSVTSLREELGFHIPSLLARIAEYEAARGRVLALCVEADQREIDGADGGVAELPAYITTRAVRRALEGT